MGDYCGSVRRHFGEYFYRRGVWAFHSFFFRTGPFNWILHYHFLNSIGKPSLGHI